MKGLSPNPNFSKWPHFLDNTATIPLLPMLVFRQGSIPPCNDIGASCQVVFAPVAAAAVAVVAERLNSLAPVAIAFVIFLLAFVLLAVFAYIPLGKQQSKTSYTTVHNF